MSRYDELSNLVNDLGPDFAKFYDKGNGNYQLQTDLGFDDITGITTLSFTDKQIDVFLDVVACDHI